MAKLPPIDYYRLTVNRIAIPDLGPLCVLLTKAGFTDFAPELVTEIKSFAQKTNHEIKAEDFLRTWIADHPTFRVREAIAHFKTDGRTAGAGYSAVKLLVEDRTLKKLGEGNYARSDMKSIAGPKKKAKSAAGNRYEVSHKDFVIRLARRNHGRLTTWNVKAAFEKDGRNRDSVSTSLAELVAAKKLKRVGDGEYVLLTKAASKKKPPTPKATNGAAVVAEADHG